MTPGQRTVAMIDDALVIAQRHPALFARMSRAGRSCLDLSIAYDAYQAGIPTRWWFTGDDAGGANRSRKRAAGKRQRQARKAQRKAGR